ncbi:MAG: tetratricopeptide repeat protein [Armatimonadetes bacterium]|nr:tetratricopeptide repeat protein [Armatimonadota bacterium]
MHEALDLSPEMAALADSLGTHGTPRERARRLYLAILDDALKVGYNEEMTADWRPNGCKSARAVFEEIGPAGERFAMCIESTMLFLALGRRMGLDTVGMRQEKSLGETADFVVAHMVAGVYDEDGWHVVDLTNRRFWKDPAGHEPLIDDMLLAYAHNNTGLIFRAQGRLYDAEKAVSAALAREHSHAAFWYNRGCVHLASGDARSARHDLTRAARLMPHSAHILTNLAVAHNALGRRASARSTLYAAREVAPGDARIRFNLGVLAYEDARYEEAEVHWRDALALEPAYAQARRSLGHLLRALGRSDEGLRLLAGLA